MRIPLLHINVTVRSLRRGVAWTTAALLLVSTAPLGAVSDSIAPVLTNVVLQSETSFDTDSDANAVRMTITATENLTDFTHSNGTYTSPSGHQTAQMACDYSAPGAVYCGASFRHYAETGVWTPTLRLTDQSGNTRTYTHADLMALGHDLRVTLTGTGDTSAPTLFGAALVAGATLTNLNPEGSNLDWTAATSDDLSGFNRAVFKAVSPGGNQTTESSCSVSPLGELTCHFSFLQYAATGQWSVSAELYDNAENKRAYTSAELLALGMDLRPTITGTGDTTKPVITSLVFGKADQIVDSLMNFSGAVVSLSATMSDNLSGVSQASMRYVSASGAQSIYNNFDYLGEGEMAVRMGLPAYAESGTWTGEMTVSDVVGNSATYSSAQLQAMGFDPDFTVTKNVSANLAAGATLSSDEELNGATAIDPVEVAVTSPDGGDVSIVIIEAGTILDPVNGYRFFDRQISISAPTANATSPMTLAFTIDASKIPVGQNENTLQVTRNGDTIPACIVPGTATPDPCVFSRVGLSNGDIEVKIYSTTASVWSSGFPEAQPLPTYTFGGFYSSIDNLPTLNRLKAGKAAKVKFSLGGDKGMSIFAAGYPTSRAISCDTSAPIDDVEEPLDASGSSLSYHTGNQQYEYTWKTNTAWQNTCRQLVLKLADGSVHPANFKFKD